MRVVGECFFWYRLTRVFPDKFHRAVKRLCVCVYIYIHGNKTSIEPNKCNSGDYKWRQLLIFTIIVVIILRSPVSKSRFNNCVWYKTLCAYEGPHKQFLPRYLGCWQSVSVQFSLNGAQIGDYSVDCVASVLTSSHCSLNTDKQLTTVEIGRIYPYFYKLTKNHIVSHKLTRAIHNHQLWFIYDLLLYNFLLSDWNMWHGVCLHINLQSKTLLNVNVSFCNASLQFSRNALSVLINLSFDSWSFRITNTGFIPKACQNPLVSKSAFNNHY